MVKAKMAKKLTHWRDYESIEPRTCCGLLIAGSAEAARVKLAPNAADVGAAYLLRNRLAEHAASERTNSSTTAWNSWSLNPQPPPA